MIPGRNFDLALALKLAGARFCRAVACLRNCVRNAKHVRFFCAFDTDFTKTRQPCDFATMRILLKIRRMSDLGRHSRIFGYIAYSSI